MTAALHAAILAALAELRALGIEPQPTTIYPEGHAALVLVGARWCKVCQAFYAGEQCETCGEGKE